MSVGRVPSTRLASRLESSLCAACPLRAAWSVLATATSSSSSHTDHDHRLDVSLSASSSSAPHNSAPQLEGPLAAAAAATAPPESGAAAGASGEPPAPIPSVPRRPAVPSCIARPTRMRWPRICACTRTAAPSSSSACCFALACQPACAPTVA
eukprot:2203510-Prymnesium_polylepis.1